jgi:purine-cytosine permease-like protein
MAKKKFLFDWTGFYAKHLVSATVEDAADKNVVLTFSPAAAVGAFAKMAYTDFTLVGKTPDLLSLNYTLGTVTIRVTASYVMGAGFNLTHNPLTKKGDTVVTAVTNNVA